jgi:NifU-like protein involved in Fe-S cluster formation
MRRDIYHYFERSYRRQPQLDLSSLRFVEDDEVQAGFVIRIASTDRIETVQYRCTTCVTLMAMCEHIVEDLQGSTVAEARTLTAERILAQHPEIPPSRRSRAHLAAAAAQAALEKL